jgi:hypothetical protein
MPKTGIVYVVECVDPDDHRVRSGRWSAHWQAYEGSRPGEGFREGPRGVSAAEAIAWGADNADTVLVTPGDEDRTYVAVGELHGFAAWPAGQELAPRHDSRLAAWARGSTAPAIRWRATFSVFRSEPFMADFGERYLEALRRQPHVVSVERQQKSETVEAQVSGQLTVLASTLFDAQDRVRTAMADTWRQGFSEEMPRPRTAQWGHSNLEPIETD